jgi:hypothetical protein
MGDHRGADGAALGLSLTPFLQPMGVGAVWSRSPAMNHDGGRCMSVWAQRPLATSTSIKTHARVSRAALKLYTRSQGKVAWAPRPPSPNRSARATDNGP